MRSLTQIKEDLRVLLQESPTWRRLLRGLIGRELLSWGASTAYLDDVAYASMTKDIHPSSATDLGLSLLSASYSIPFQNFSAGYLLYKYIGSVALKPYALTHSYNGTTWFNTEPLLPNTTAVLYQGSPKGIVSVSGAFQPVFPNIQEVMEVLPSDIYLDQDRSFFYVRLKGDNIIPSSVRVHLLAVTSTVPAPTYKARLMTSEEVSSATFFSVYSLPDGGQAVRFHESVPDKFQVSYFTADLSMPDAMVDVGSPTSPIVSVVNPSTTNASKRAGFMKAMSAQSALSTATQIEEFCRSVGVIDAKAERFAVSAGLFSVAVFFVSTVDSPDVNNYFEKSLSEALSLYGSIATNFKVHAGTEVSFQVHATSQTPFDNSSFSDLVRNYFNVEFPPSFSTSLTEDLLVYAHSNGFTGVSLSYLLHIPFSNVSLLPRFGSIFTDYSFIKDGVLKAWSFGSKILGHSGANRPFAETDTYFVLTDSILVWSSGVFYIFDKDTGSGSMLSIPSKVPITARDNMILLRSFATADLGSVFALSLSPSDQRHAIATGVLPSIVGISIPNVSRSSLKIYTEGYFSYLSGNSTQLFQHQGNSIASLGVVPNLLFVLGGYFYYTSSDLGILLRKSSLSSSAFTEVSIAVYGAPITPQELFHGSKLSFSGTTLTSVRNSDNLAFMFSLSQDSNSLVATSLPSPISAGFTKPFNLTTVPARWGTGSPEWYSFTASAWVQFSPVVFSDVIGSILADGTPSFDTQLSYDFLTVDTSSASPFSAFSEAVYFRLNDATPVVFK